MALLDEFRVDRTIGSNGTVLPSALPGWLSSYCSSNGVCKEHTYFVGDDDRLGPIVIGLPREAVEENGEVPDVILAPLYKAIVRTAQGPFMASVPPFTGRTRPTVKMVLHHVLRNFSSQVPSWESFDVANLNSVADHRLCSIFAQMDRDHLLAGSCKFDVVATDEFGVRGLVTAILGKPFQSSLERRATASKVPPVKAKRTNEDKLRSLQQEMLVTERNYVRTIELIYDKYYVQLESQSHLPSAFITPAEVRVIFSGITKIVEVNRAFLADLESVLALQTTPRTKVATASFEEIVLRHVKGFQVYTNYVNYYQSSVDTLKRCKERSKALVAFLQSCQLLPGVERMDLSGLLITPIQRVPRYVLLLRDMLNNTQEDNENRHLLQEAYEKMDAMAQYIDETKRQADARATIFAIQEDVEDCPPTIVSSTRQFQGQLDCQECDAATGEAKPSFWTIYVFDDYILLAKRKQKMTLMSSKKWRRKFWRLIDVTKMAVKTFANAESMLTIEFPSSDGSTIESLTLTSQAPPALSSTPTTTSLGSTASASDDLIADIASLATMLTQTAIQRKQKTDLLEVIQRQHDQREIVFHVRSCLSAAYYTPSATSMRSISLVFYGERSDLNTIIPKSMLENSYMLVLVQALNNGGFKVDVRSRSESLPLFDPDIRGNFEVEAATAFGELLLKKLLNGQNCFCQHVLERQAYRDDLYKKNIVDILQNLLSPDQLKRITSQRRSNSRASTPHHLSPRRETTATDAGDGNFTTIKQIVGTIKNTPATLGYRNSLMKAFSLGGTFKSSSTTISSSSKAFVWVEQQNLTVLTELIEAKGILKAELYTSLPRKAKNEMKTQEQIASLTPADKEQTISREALKGQELSVVTGVLFAYLRLLPPLLPSSLHKQLAEACNWEYALESSVLLKKCLAILPNYQYTLLKIIIGHLKRVCDSPGNACHFIGMEEIFAPILLEQAAPKTDEMDIASVVAVQETLPSIVAKLIEQYDDLFSNDRDLSNDLPALPISTIVGDSKRRKLTPTEPMTNLSINTDENKDLREESSESITSDHVRASVAMLTTRMRSSSSASDRVRPSVSVDSLFMMESPVAPSTAEEKENRKEDERASSSSDASSSKLAAAKATLASLQTNSSIKAKQDELVALHKRASELERVVAGEI